MWRNPPRKVVCPRGGCLVEAPAARRLDREVRAASVSQFDRDGSDLPLRYSVTAIDEQIVLAADVRLKIRVGAELKRQDVLCDADKAPPSHTHIGVAHVLDRGWLVGRDELVGEERRSCLDVDMLDRPVALQDNLHLCPNLLSPGPIPAPGIQGFGKQSQLALGIRQPQPARPGVPVEYDVMGPTIIHRHAVCEMPT